MLNISKETTEYIKIIIMLLAAFLLLAEYFYYRHRTKKNSSAEAGRTFKIVFASLLTILAVVSVANYYSFSWRVASHDMEPYDLFHYYLNSRYFDKLEYDRLYDCAIFADSQKKKRFKNIAVARDLATYRMKSREDILRDGKECRKLFNDNEWYKFRSDVGLLGGLMSRYSLKTMFLDRGYNATPAGNFILSLFSRNVDVRYIRWLNKIDCVLVLLAFVAITWAYGWNISLFSLIIFTTMWPTRWPLVGHAFMRYDWISALIIGICLTARKHHAAGGALVAYAALVRIFPLVFVAGLGLKYLREVNWHEVRGNLRRLYVPQYMHFAAGFMAVALIITAASLLMYPPAQYSAFASDMKEHVKAENLSYQRMGFEIASHYDGETERAQMLGGVNHLRKHEIEKDRRVNCYLTLAVLLGMLLFIRARRDDEALMLGFIVFFFACSASYYYYVAMFPMVLLHLNNRSRPLHLIALGILLAGSVFAYLVQNLNGFRYYATAGASNILLLYCIFVMLTYLIPLLIKNSSGACCKGNRSSWLKA